VWFQLAGRLLGGRAVWRPHREHLVAVAVTTSRGGDEEEAVSDGARVSSVGDEYAARHMAAGRRIHYFDKRTMPRWMRALMIGGMGLGAGAVIGVALAGLVTGEAPALLGLLPLYAVAAAVQVAFWTLRTVVTDEFVHVQYGMMGPKIAIEDIVSVDVAVYDWKRFGGWGVLPVSGGVTAYNMLGDQGRAVRIVFRDGAKTKEILVSASKPEILAAAIQESARAHRALARRRSPRTRRQRRCWRSRQQRSRDRPRRRRS